MYFCFMQDLVIVLNQFDLVFGFVDGNIIVIVRGKLFFRSGSYVTFFIGISRNNSFFLV